MLAAALEFGSAGASALNPLLKIGSWLPADDFNTKVIFLLLFLDVKLVFRIIMHWYDFALCDSVI